MKHKFVIIDWASNVCFQGTEFNSFDEAEEFLSERLGNNYETDRGEYYIESGLMLRESAYLDPRDVRARPKAR